MTRTEMLERGRRLIALFCAENRMPAPNIATHGRGDWQFSVCAYYRPRTIHVVPEMCAPIGTAGRQWSYPGYVVDRTPYGVLAHELGHHVDVLHGHKLGLWLGPYFSDFSVRIREASGEEPLTSYAAQNAAEWFAESFRLFVTNPDLLLELRPRTFVELGRYGLKPVFTDNWVCRLAEAPARTIQAARRKVEAARVVGLAL